MSKCSAIIPYLHLMAGYSLHVGGEGQWLAVITRSYYFAKFSRFSHCFRVIFVWVVCNLRKLREEPGKCRPVSLMTGNIWQILQSIINDAMMEENTLKHFQFCKEFSEVRVRPDIPD